MTTNTFIQPLLERLVEYVGVRQTLQYASTCRSHALARKWLIENCSLVDYRRISELRKRGIEPKSVSAIPGTLKDLQKVPAIVTHVTFADSFNNSLLNATLPPKLTHLTFGYYFNRSLDHITLPLNLTHLTFGGRFNRPLDNVTLPSKLTHLTFGSNFNQPLDNVTLPPTLTNLEFGYHFNQSLDNLTLPPRLTLLTFGYLFDRMLNYAKLPPTLTCIKIDCEWRFYLHNQHCMTQWLRSGRSLCRGQTK